MRGNKKLLTEGTILFLSTLIVNIGNYGINLLLGRWMNPAEFSEVMLLVTLLLVFSFIALGFQLTAAKFVAELQATKELDQLQGMITWMKKSSIIVGVVVGGLIVIFASYWQKIFQMTSPIPFIYFGIGMGFYFWMSLNRGILQGQENFKKLALTYQVEMWSRLILTVLLVKIGWGVNGVSLAIAISIFLTLLSSWTQRVSEREAAFQKKVIYSFLFLILSYECSQILINNSDTILVKYFYEPYEAGLYGALALIGRIVYFGTWTVVTILFPIVIKMEKEGKDHFPVFIGGLSLVALMAAIIIGGTYLFPEWIVTSLFGKAYIEIAPFLWKYGVATGLFALSNVFVYYNLSLDRIQPALISLLAGLAQVFLIIIFHQDFNQIIEVQIYLMSLLLIVMIVFEFLLKPKKIIQHA